MSPDDAADNDAPPATAPEKSARSPNGVYEFREERWVELYTKKIEEMIGVLKSKGVPVLWVGLPAVRGAKATADMLFLDSLYRDAAGKAGITYVDVWDGFVDEAGRFLQQGPDFEGQIRQLRSYDGVYFTKARRAQARALCRARDHAAAGRALRRRSRCRPNRRRPTPMRVPGQPAPRPLAGPILPLVASSVGTDQLLGGPGSRPAAVDALAARTLVKGEPLAPPAGRADDFAWPRREVGREQAKGETPVAHPPRRTDTGGGTQRSHRRSRKSPTDSIQPPTAPQPARRRAISSALATRRASRRQPHRRPRPPGTVGRRRTSGLFTR